MFSVYFIISIFGRPLLIVESFSLDSLQSFWVLIADLCRLLTKKRTFSNAPIFDVFMQFVLALTLADLATVSFQAHNNSIECSYANAWFVVHARNKFMYQ